MTARISLQRILHLAAGISGTAGGLVNGFAGQLRRYVQEATGAKMGQEGSGFEEYGSRNHREYSYLAPEPEEGTLHYAHVRADDVEPGKELTIGTIAPLLYRSRTNWGPFGGGRARNLFNFTDQMQGNFLDGTREDVNQSVVRGVAGNIQKAINFKVHVSWVELEGGGSIRGAAEGQWDHILKNIRQDLKSWATGDPEHFAFMGGGRRNSGTQDTLQPYHDPLGFLRWVGRLEGWLLVKPTEGLSLEELSNLEGKTIRFRDPYTVTEIPGDYYRGEDFEIPAGTEAQVDEGAADGVALTVFLEGFERFFWLYESDKLPVLEESS